MTIRHALVSSLLCAILVVAGCGDGNDGSDGRDSSAASQTAADDHAAGTSPAAGQTARAAAKRTGEVVQTMDSGGYTYAQIDCDGETVWAAGPVTGLAVGDEVTVSTAMPMRDFRAGSLDRTFDVIYFTDGFGGEASAGHGGQGGMPGGMMGHGGQSGMPGGHPPLEAGAELDLDGIARADGGKTVAEVWAERQALAGQEVAIRGRVVKYSPSIMGKNWLHLRDGTGAAADGTHDLTVTTQGFARVGDLVTVTGTVAVDRDLGMGYQYDVIVEQADVVKE